MRINILGVEKDNALSQWIWWDIEQVGHIGSGKLLDTNTLLKSLLTQYVDEYNAEVFVDLALLIFSDNYIQSEGYKFLTPHILSSDEIQEKDTNAVSTNCKIILVQRSNITIPFDGKYNEMPRIDFTGVKAGDNATAKEILLTGLKKATDQQPTNLPDIKIPHVDKNILN